jgi:hypothetical protein
VIDVCTRVIVKHTPVIVKHTPVIDMCTGVIVKHKGVIIKHKGVIDGCTGVIVKRTYAIGMYSSAIAVGGASTAGTEPPMLLQVGDKVAYRKGMTWVVDHSRHGGRQLSTRCTP